MRGRRLMIVVLPAVLAGCERGCARAWLGERGLSPEGRKQPGSAPVNALDCPDGLARCSAGVVEVSRLAMIPQPCAGPPEQCACRWDPVGDCGGGCVAEGLEVVVPRERAAAQLCSPPAGTVLVSPPNPGEVPRGCDEGQLYGCWAGAVTSCRENAVAARCLRGCAEDGTSVDDDVPVTREAAFAILCTR